MSQASICCQALTWRQKAETLCVHLLKVKISSVICIWAGRHCYLWSTIKLLMGASLTNKLVLYYIKKKCTGYWPLFRGRRMKQALNMNILSPQLHRQRFNPTFYSLGSDTLFTAPDIFPKKSNFHHHSLVLLSAGI